MRHAFPEGDSFSSVVVVSLLSKSTAEIIVIIMCFLSPFLSIDSTKRCDKIYLCCVCIICYPLSSHQQQFSLSYDFLHISDAYMSKIVIIIKIFSVVIAWHFSSSTYFAYIRFTMDMWTCCKKHVTKIKFSDIILSYLCSPVEISSYSLKITVNH